MTNKRLKIGLVAPAHNPLPYPKDRSWAPGILIFNLSKELSRLGHDVYVFAADDSETSDEKIHQVPIGLNSIFNDFPQLRENDFQKFTELFAMYDLVIINRALKFAKENKIDILHFHDIRRPLFFLENTSQKMVFTYHAPLDQYFIYWLKNARKTIGEKAYITTLSQNHSQEFKKYFQNVEIIGNGVDAQHFQFSDRAENEFIFIGRFIESKGIEIALKLAKETGIKLTLYGNEGDTKNDKEYYAKLKAEHENLSNILFSGYKDYQEMPEIYAGAKAMIFPLMGKEAFGMTIIESMSCGTPVIAYDREATGEIIKNNENGLLVEADNFEALKEAVLKINEMPETEYLQMRKNARNHVLEKFSLEIMAKQFVDYYHKIIQWEENNAQS